MKYERRHDTVIIMGSHPGTRNEYDWNRSDADVWVFNEAVLNDLGKNHGFAPPEKVAAVFQLHKPVIWKNPKNRNDGNHYQWLQQTDIPVFMQDEYPEIKTSVKYPLDEITSTLTNKLLTSSVAQAMALAVYLGYKRVEIYGVEMETGTEYTTQRPGVAYWAGRLDGMGVELDAHWKLFDEYVYGFEGDVVLTEKEFTDKITEVTPECNRLKEIYENRFKEVQTLLDTAITTGATSDGKKFADAFIELAQMGQEFGAVDGQRQEAERYLKKAEEMKKVSGEFIFSRQEFESGMMIHGQNSQKALQDSHVAGGKFESMFNQMMKTLSKKNRIKRMNQLAPHMESYVKVGIKAAMHAGGAQFNREMMNKLDKLIQAAGGKKSEEAMLEVMS